MRMSSVGAPRLTPTAREPAVHRMCAGCEEEVQKKGEGESKSEEEDDEDFDDDDESGLPKLEAGVAAPRSVARDVVPAGSGRRLEPGVERFMGERFGRDFSGVEIHDDAAAAASAKRLSAQAYTVGSHVYFAQGRYAPGAGDGQRLLAHELAHVVQKAHAPEAVHREPDAGVEEKPPGDAGTTDVKPGDEGATEEGPGKSTKNAGSTPGSGAGCPQGKSKTGEHHGDCTSGGPPINQSKWIKHLEVSVSAYTVDVTWSDGSKEQWPCTPRPSSKKHKGTPLGPDKIGKKCGVNHTNLITPKRKIPDGMAWFTGLAKQGLRVGFHDSQPIGKSYQSHGCIRVHCNHAKIINQNTWSGQTTVNVS
jgi:hypothetical protein